jgi:hypothetical protein
VAENHPDIYLDVCDYWLNKLWYQVPLKEEVFRENLCKILNYIQVNRNIVVFDSNSFVKWLKFIKYLPVKTEQVTRHFEKMVKFECLPRLAECIKELGQFMAQLP